MTSDTSRVGPCGCHSWSFPQDFTDLAVRVTVNRARLRKRRRPGAPDRRPQGAREVVRQPGA